MTTKIKIDIDGIDEVRRFFVEMPKRMNINISKTNEKFMEKLRKTMKKLAPKDTGTLAEDIKRVPVRKGKNVKIWKISIINPAAAPQEFGFKPHWAPILNSSKIPPGVYFVSKSTSFIRPAIEQNISFFSQQLNHAVRRAIRK